MTSAHWTATTTDAPKTERRRLVVARRLLWEARAPRADAADRVVPPFTRLHAACGLACGLIGVWSALALCMYTVPLLFGGGWLVMVIGITALLPAAFMLRAWFRARSVRIHRFAAAVRCVRSEPARRMGYKLIRRHHEVQLAGRGWFARRYVTDSGLAGRLVEGDVGIAFVRGRRLVGFAPVRFESGRARVLDLRSASERK